MSYRQFVRRIVTVYDVDDLVTLDRKGGRSGSGLSGTFSVRLKHFLTKFE